MEIIKSGNYEVLFSGTVIGIKDEPILISFPPKYGALNLIFDFVDDDKTNEPKTQVEFPEKKVLKLTLVNAQTSLGIGNSELMALGHVNGRRLYLNYRIYSVAELSKTVHYTFYLGEEVKNV